MQIAYQDENREDKVEEQIQQILLYMQEKSADMWKENILEDLKIGLLEYETVEEFLTKLKKEFEEREKKNSQSNRTKKNKTRRKNDE